MYVLIYLAIFLNILVITKYKYKTLMKSNILFTVVWCVCASCSSLGLYGLYRPSFIVHFYSISAILSYNCTYLLFNKVYITSNKFKESWKGRINEKTIYLLNLFSWIYMIRFINKSVSIILSGGFNTLRAYAYNSSMGLGSTIELLIAQIFVEAVFSVTILISALDLNNNREYPYLAIISFIDILIYTVSFAGRGMLTIYIIYSVLGFIILRLSNKTIKIKKLKKRTYITIIIGIVMMYFLTKARGWGEVSFIKELYLYMVGPFSFLDAILHESAISQNNQSLLYGKAIFGFIYNLINMPLSYIFKYDYNGSDYLITTITSQVRFISPDRMYNALTTMIYPFLRDFGYFGVIFGSSFFAYIVNVAEKRYKEKKDLTYLFIYCLLLLNLFNSVKNYYLYSPTFGMTILLIFLITKKISLKRRGE